MALIMGRLNGNVVRHWKKKYNQYNELAPSIACFYLDKEQRRSMVRLFKTVLRLHLEHNIEMFVAYGTLLGFVRNGDLLPWADDINFIIPESAKEKLMAIDKSILKMLKISITLEDDRIIITPFEKGHMYSWPAAELFFSNDGSCIYNEDAKVVYQLSSFSIENQTNKFKIPIPENSEQLLDNDYPQWKSIITGIQAHHPNRQHLVVGSVNAKYDVITGLLIE